ncbi:protein SIEVE ELEMENT OCCLUSION B-like isoform X1 [Quercus robur]|uniref:protein SIEVE ELEMENT OCCLUSION B-like isoform X1 n=1 Tax=Quercus robur TaxID=38942 RepID=UPI002163B59D|nr:protein SIEVE ELEMENT OCCLUSION B-like isoform X1 [Quercus robur]
MASANIVLASAQQPIKAELRVLTMSDEQIMNHIYATHVHADDDNFDEDSLFAIVENILKHATVVADNVMLGTHGHPENIHEKAPKVGFTPPLCMLRHLSSLMTCKSPGEEFAHKTTLSILNNLSNYSWDSKAVLTLAAFAMEYGDFWLLTQLHSSDQLAKPIGILKRVPTILSRPGLQKHKKAMLELNNLVKVTLEVIQCMFELEKLSIYGTKDVPELSIAMDRIPIDVYWAIITIAACMTQMCCIINDEDRTQDLSPFAQKVNYTLNLLRMQITRCRQQIEIIEAYRKLSKLLQTPTEIMEVFKALIFGKDNVQPLIDGSTNRVVTIDVLKKKNVLFYISALDITIDDILILKPIYDGIRKEDQYKIVWIPIVEQWTDELRKKFEMLRSKMPWYIVQYFSPVVGIKFIKEEWNFKNKPILVVMNQQGKVQHPNALHMIRVWGMKAFPFTTTVEETLTNRVDGIVSVWFDIHPDVANWIKQEKYIFFYGGKDNEWIQQFNKKAATLANDPVMKDTKISIELFCVGKGNKGEDEPNILGHFWNRVESFFFSKTHKKTEQDIVTQEIQKLLSYKTESGWAVLSKGSRLVVSGNGTTMLKVLEEFGKKKELVREVGFEICFKDHYEKIIQTGRHCCRVDIPMNAGKYPEHIKCPECPRIMETYISYKCCHIDGPMNALH